MLHKVALLYVVRVARRKKKSIKTASTDIHLRCFFIAYYAV